MSTTAVVLLLATAILLTALLAWVAGAPRRGARREFEDARRTAAASRRSTGRRGPRHPGSERDVVPGARAAEGSGRFASGRHAAPADEFVGERRQS